jgi:hypothetical protein
MTWHAFKSIQLFIFLLSTIVVEVHAQRIGTLKENIYKGGEASTVYKKPDQLNDGIQTATLKDVG